MKLVIMFLVGLALAGGSAWYLIYGDALFEDKIILIFPGIIGVVLILLSATSGLRKFNNYLDN